MRWLFSMLLLTACEMPDPTESIAFITIIEEDGNPLVGSGFMIESGYIATAHHVAKHKGTFFLKNHKGEETTATVAYVNTKSDIALLKPKENIWSDYLETGKVDSGGIKKGFIYGRSNRSQEPNTAVISGPMSLTHDHVRLLGMSGKSGMSGGPCIIDGYAVGVFSFSSKPKGTDEISIGIATCDTFALSTNYIEVIQPEEQ